MSAERDAAAQPERGVQGTFQIVSLRDGSPVLDVRTASGDGTSRLQLLETGTSVRVLGVHPQINPNGEAEYPTLGVSFHRVLWRQSASDR